MPNADPTQIDLLAKSQGLFTKRERSVCDTDTVQVV
jgi:hypothetical protein